MSPSPDGPHENGGEQGWSAYRWGILKAISDLTDALAERAREACKDLEATETRLAAKIVEESARLAGTLSVLDALVRVHDREISNMKGQAAVLGAAGGLIFGAIAGAVAAKLIE